MCGRFALDLSWSEILNEYAAPPDPGQNYEIELGLRPNIFPGQPVGIIRTTPVGPVGTSALWGFAPAWSRTPPGQGRPLINARSETAALKPTFRNALRHGRCLVPATAFYEWQPTHAGKIPHRIAPAQGRTFALAGLCEAWRGPDDSHVLTVAILTTQANPSLSEIHDRMPVVVPPDGLDLWLSPSTRPDELQTLFVPAPDDAITVTRLDCLPG